jgi:hypothetical protein
MIQRAYRIGFVFLGVSLFLTAGCGGKAAEDQGNPVTLPSLQNNPSNDEPLVSDPAGTANLIHSCASAVIDPHAYTRSLRTAMSRRLPRGAKPRIGGLAPNRFGADCGQALPVALGTLNYDTFTQGYWGQDDVVLLLRQILAVLQQRPWWGSQWNGMGWGGSGRCGIEPYLPFRQQASWGSGSGLGGGFCGDWLFPQPFGFSGGSVPWSYGFGW